MQQASQEQAGASVAIYQSGPAPDGDPGLQLDSFPGTKLPPGFDPSTCRSVYVGNIHNKVTESMLADIFSNLGELEGCKLIRKGQTSYGFVDYFEHAAAEAALVNLNGRQLFGQPIRVNWAFQGAYKDDTSSHLSIFVGDLGYEITDASLYEAFKGYPSCSGAKVMMDNKTGRTKGYGFVSFRLQADAEAAITEMTGKWVGSRPVRCNWATKGASAAVASQQQHHHQPPHPHLRPQQTSGDPNQQGGAQGPLSAHNGSGLGGHLDLTPQFTTVFVGNLSPEVSQVELHRHFYALGLGVIEEVKVNRDKGFGFVRYSSSREAEAAIRMANGTVVGGRPVKCSWGSKPTIPSPMPTPLPPPPGMGPPGASPGVFGASPGSYGSSYGVYGLSSGALQTGMPPPGAMGGMHPMGHMGPAGLRAAGMHGMGMGMEMGVGVPQAAPNSMGMPMGVTGPPGYPGAGSPMIGNGAMGGTGVVGPAGAGAAAYDMPAGSAQAAGYNPQQHYH